MKRNVTRDAVVGAVVLAAVLIFTFGIFMIGSEQKVWVKKVPYKLMVPDANGLQSGSPVRLAGVQVGTITDVDFSSDPNTKMIQVDLAIDQAHRHRIRADTVANVKILTLLGGDRYVELTPGSTSEPELPADSFIRVPASFGMEQLGELSANLSSDIQSISRNVRIILETVQKQEGVVGKMLLDPNFGQKTFDDIAQSAALVRNTLEGVNSGKGIVGRVLRDDDFATRTTASVERSLQRIEMLLDRMTAEQGVVDRALDPNGKVTAAIDNFHQVTADLAAFTEDLKRGEGALGRLVTDDQYGKELLDNLKKISTDLADITGRIKKGEGTLGGMINDPQLYQDLKNVVRGVQKSRILSGLIRHYRKKGEKVTGETGAGATPAEDPNAVQDPNGTGGGE